MKKGFTLLAILAMFSQQQVFAQSASDCDQNGTHVIDDCNKTFDLCLDQYTLNTTDDSYVLKIFNNDLGYFNPCDAEIVTGNGYPKYGSVTQNASCDAVYTMSTSTNLPPSYKDTFFYEITYANVCAPPTNYCGSNDGKIWSMEILYQGKKDVNRLRVYDDKKNQPFETINTTISNGDLIYIDGSGNGVLGKGQSGWNFVFDFADGGTETVGVHTSCSELIFGVQQGNLFTPLAGCVSPQKKRGDCNTVKSAIYDDYQIKTRSVEETTPEVQEVINAAAQYVTTFQTDITLVELTLTSQLLPINFGALSAANRTDDIHVSWEILDVVNEEKLILEKSYDGLTFSEVETYYYLQPGKFEYFDKEIEAELLHYRLAVYNYEGKVTYSDIFTNLRSLKEVRFDAFPNPARDLLHINLYGNKSKVNMTRLDLVDMSGRTVISRQGETESIDVSTVGAGLYMVRAELSNGERKYKKIIIQ